MPRGIPNARPSAGAAQSRASELFVWDGFAASALIGMLQRGNQSSAESVQAAANAADRMMEEREKRFGKPVVAPAEAEGEE